MAGLLVSKRLSSATAEFGLQDPTMGTMDPGTESYISDDSHEEIKREDD
jgi:hypothetical protein